MLALSSEIVRAYNDRDWERFGSLLARDFVLSNYLPAAAGEIRGRDAYITFARGLIELVPDARTEIAAIHAVTSSGLVTTLRMRGTSHEGVDVEITTIDIATIGDGLLRRLDRYTEERLDEALADFTARSP